MGNGSVPASGVGTSVPPRLSPLPPPPAIKPPEPAEKKAAPPPSPLNQNELKELTKTAKTFGVDLKDLLDAQGKLPPEKFAAAALRIAGEARKRKDPGAAARLFQNAVRLDPQDLSLRMEHAKAKFTWSNKTENPEARQQLIQEARSELNVILQKNPNHVEALKTKALSFGLDPGIIGDDGRVVNESLLPPALRGQNLPPARILTSLAHFYASDLEKKAETARREGKTEEAERYLARARSLVDAGLEVDPTHAASHRKIAAWKATEGKAQEAKAHLETAERLEENQSSEKYKLGFDPKANPVVGGLYEALADEGIPNGSLNQGTEGQKDLVIKGGEVLDYVGRNLDDPRVRRALAAVGIAIPKGLEAAIREKGFGKAMAEHHAARAVALSQQGGSKNIQPAAEQLTLAACYEPENPARFAAVGDFYAEHDRHFLAFNMFAAAQQIANQEKGAALVPELEQKLRVSYENSQRAGIEQAARFETAGNATAHEEIARALIGQAELYGKLFPDKAKEHGYLRDLGDLHARLGRALTAQGKKSAAAPALKKATELYQAAIEARPNDAAFCIDTYKKRAEAFHALGDYQAAAKNFMLASQCAKLRIQYDPNNPTGQVPPLEQVKQDRTIRTRGDDFLPPEPDSLGNYLPNGVHRIDSTEGLDALPAWADQGLAAYDRRLDDSLRTLVENQAALGSNNTAILENIEEQAKILEFLGQTDEAQTVRAEAAALQDQETLAQLEQTAATLGQAGLLDHEGLNQVTDKENRGHEETLLFSYYVQLPAVPGEKTGLPFHPDYQQLDVKDKIRVLQAVVHSGERNVIARNRAQAQGPAQVFYDAQLAVFDGDPKKAQEKFTEFAKLSQDSPDPQIQALRRQAETALGFLEKDEKNILRETRTLLAPLAMTLKPGKDGGIDLSTISKDRVKSFEDFRGYLIDQVAIDGVAFNQTWLASYSRVLQDPKHEALLRRLYAEFNPEAEPVAPLSTAQLDKALRAFTVDLAKVSESRFVSNLITNKSGRKTLKNLLEDPSLDRSFKADLLEEIVDAGERQGYVPQHLRQLFEKQLSTYWIDIDITDKEITKATDYGRRILDIADGRDSTRGTQVDRYEHHSEEVQRLQAGNLETPITSDSVREMALAVKANREKTDNLSQMKARLGTMWLSVIDNDNWGVEQGSSLRASRVGEQDRAVMANRLREFLEEADQVHGDADFLAFSKRVRRYLRGQGEGKSDDLVESKIQTAGALRDGAEWGIELIRNLLPGQVDDHFSERNPAVAQGYSDLLKMADEFSAAESMGLQVHASNPEVGATDPKQQELATKLIQDLRGIQRSYCYQYKQRNLLSRSFSATGAAAGRGDVAGIQKANEEIDALIEQIAAAKSPEDFAAVSQHLTDATREGGAIYKGFAAAEMNGYEQMINLGQTVLEMMAIAVVTRGMGTEAALTRAAATLRRTRNLKNAYEAFKEVRAVSQLAEGARAAEAAEMARYGSAYREMRAFQGAATAAEEGEVVWAAARSGAPALRGIGSRVASAIEGEVGFAAKVSRGFQMGARISLTENAVASLSGQLKTDPQSLLDWLKDALSTGLATGLSGGLVPHAVETAGNNLLKGLWQRYATEGAKGAMHFLADTGLEVVEELVDAYVRKCLDGDYRMLSWNEMRDIVIVCVGGGGTKMGALAQFVGHGVQDSRAQKAVDGFQNRGERVVYDANHGYVLVDSEGAFVRKVKKNVALAYVQFDAAENGAEAEGIQVVRFAKAKKGTPGEPAVEDLPAAEPASFVDAAEPEPVVAQSESEAVVPQTAEAEAPLAETDVISAEEKIPSAEEEATEPEAAAVTAEPAVMDNDAVEDLEPLWTDAETEADNARIPDAVWQTVAVGSPPPLRPGVSPGLPRVVLMTTGMMLAVSQAGAQTLSGQETAKTQEWLGVPPSDFLLPDGGLRPAIVIGTAPGSSGWSVAPAAVTSATPETQVPGAKKTTETVGAPDRSAPEAQGEPTNAPFLAALGVVGALAVVGGRKLKQFLDKKRAEAAEGKKKTSEKKVQGGKTGSGAGRDQGQNQRQRERAFWKQLEKRCTDEKQSNLFRRIQNRNNPVRQAIDRFLADHANDPSALATFQNGLSPDRIREALGASGILWAALRQGGASLTDSAAVEQVAWTLGEVLTGKLDLDAVEKFCTEFRSSIKPPSSDKTLTIETVAESSTEAALPPHEADQTQPKPSAPDLRARLAAIAAKDREKKLAREKTIQEGVERVLYVTGELSAGDLFEHARDLREEADQLTEAGDELKAAVRLAQAEAVENRARSQVPNLRERLKRDRGKAEAAPPARSGEEERLAAARRGEARVEIPTESVPSESLPAPSRDVRGRGRLVGPNGPLALEGGNPVEVVLPTARLEITATENGRQILRVEIGHAEIQRAGETAWTPVPQDGIELQHHDQLRVGRQILSWEPALELVSDPATVESSPLGRKTAAPALSFSEVRDRIDHLINFFPLLTERCGLHHPQIQDFTERASDIFKNLPQLEKNPEIRNSTVQSLLALEVEFEVFWKDEIRESVDVAERAFADLAPQAYARFQEKYSPSQTNILPALDLNDTYQDFVQESFQEVLRGEMGLSPTEELPESLHTTLGQVVENLTNLSLLRGGLSPETVREFAAVTARMYRDWETAGSAGSFSLDIFPLSRHLLLGTHPSADSYLQTITQNIQGYYRVFGPQAVSLFSKQGRLVSGLTDAAGNPTGFYLVAQRGNYEAASGIQLQVYEGYPNPQKPLAYTAQVQMNFGADNALQIVNLQGPAREIPPRMRAPEGTFKRFQQSYGGKGQVFDMLVATAMMMGRNAGFTSVQGIKGEAQTAHQDDKRTRRFKGKLKALNEKASASRQQRKDWWADASGEGDFYNGTFGRLGFAPPEADSDYWTLDTQTLEIHRETQPARVATPPGTPGHVIGERTTLPTAGPNTPGDFLRQVLIRRNEADKLIYNKWDRQKPRSLAEPVVAFWKVFMPGILNLGYEIGHAGQDIRRTLEAPNPFAAPQPDAGEAAPVSDRDARLQRLRNRGVSEVEAPTDREAALERLRARSGQEASAAPTVETPSPADTILPPPPSQGAPGVDIAAHPPPPLHLEERAQAETLIYEKMMEGTPHEARDAYRQQVLVDELMAIAALYESTGMEALPLALRADLDTVFHARENSPELADAVARLARVLELRRQDARFNRVPALDWLDPVVQAEFTAEVANLYQVQEIFPLARTQVVADGTIYGATIEEKPEGTGVPLFNTSEAGFPRGGAANENAFLDVSGEAVDTDEAILFNQDKANALIEDQAFQEALSRHSNELGLGETDQRNFQTEAEFSIGEEVGRRYQEGETDLTLTESLEILGRLAETYEPIEAPRQAPSVEPPANREELLAKLRERHAANTTPTAPTPLEQALGVIQATAAKMEQAGVEVKPKSGEVAAVLANTFLGSRASEPAVRDDAINEAVAFLEARMERYPEYAKALKNLLSAIARQAPTLELSLEQIEAFAVGTEDLILRTAEEGGRETSSRRTAWIPTRARTILERSGIPPTSPIGLALAEVLRESYRIGEGRGAPLPQPELAPAAPAPPSPPPPSPPPLDPALRAAERQKRATSSAAQVDYLAASAPLIADNVPGSPRQGEWNGAATAHHGSFSMATDPGPYKTLKADGVTPLNEDAAHALVDASGQMIGGLLLDGMGGHDDGDVASQVAGKAIVAYLSEHAHEVQAVDWTQRDAKQRVAEILGRALLAGHEAIVSHPPWQGRKGNFPGTTAVAYWIVRAPDGQDYAVIAHSGDSGALVAGSHGKVKYRSVDQSTVQELFDAARPQRGKPKAIPGSPDPGEELARRAHPQANVVHHPLGSTQAGQQPRPVVRMIPLEVGDRIALFTDGPGDNHSTQELAEMARDPAGVESGRHRIMESTLAKMNLTENFGSKEKVTLRLGGRVRVTLPNGRTAYLALDLDDEGKRSICNIYDRKQGGTLIDHLKPDNASAFLYEHNPIEPARPTASAVQTAAPAVEASAPQTAVPPAAPLPRFQSRFETSVFGATSFQEAIHRQARAILDPLREKGNMRMETRAEFGELSADVYSLIDRVMEMAATGRDPLDPGTALSPTEVRHRGLQAARDLLGEHKIRDMAGFEQDLYRLIQDIVQGTRVNQRVEALLAEAEANAGRFRSGNRNTFSSFDQIIDVATVQARALVQSQRLGPSLEAALYQLVQETLRDGSRTPQTKTETTAPPTVVTEPEIVDVTADAVLEPEANHGVAAMTAGLAAAWSAMGRGAGAAWNFARAVLLSPAGFLLGAGGGAPLMILSPALARASQRDAAAGRRSTPSPLAWTADSTVRTREETGPPRQVRVLSAQSQGGDLSLEVVFEATGFIPNNQPPLMQAQVVAQEFGMVELELSPNTNIFTGKSQHPDVPVPRQIRLKISQTAASELGLLQEIPYGRAAVKTQDIGRYFPVPVQVRFGEEASTPEGQSALRGMAALAPEGLEAEIEKLFPSATETQQDELLGVVQVACLHHGLTLQGVLKVHETLQNLAAQTKTPDTPYKRNKVYEHFQAALLSPKGPTEYLKAFDVDRHLQSFGIHAELLPAEARAALLNQALINPNPNSLRNRLENLHEKIASQLAEAGISESHPQFGALCSGLLAEALASEKPEAYLLQTRPEQILKNVEEFLSTLGFDAADPDLAALRDSLVVLALESGELKTSQALEPTALALRAAVTDPVKRARLADSTAGRDLRRKYERLLLRWGIQLGVPFAEFTHPQAWARAALQDPRLREPLSRAGQQVFGDAWASSAEAQDFLGRLLQWGLLEFPGDMLFEGLADLDLAARQAPLENVVNERLGPVKKVRTPSGNIRDMHPSDSPPGRAVLGELLLESLWAETRPELQASPPAPAKLELEGLAKELAETIPDERRALKMAGRNYRDILFSEAAAQPEWYAQKNRSSIQNNAEAREFFARADQTLGEIDRLLDTIEAMEAAFGPGTNSVKRNELYAELQERIHRFERFQNHLEEHRQVSRRVGMAGEGRPFFVSRGEYSHARAEGPDAVAAYLSRFTKPVSKETYEGIPITGAHPVEAPPFQNFAEGHAVSGGFGWVVYVDEGRYPGGTSYQKALVDQVVMQYRREGYEIREDRSNPQQPRLLLTNSDRTLRFFVGVEIHPKGTPKGELQAPNSDWSSAKVIASPSPKPRTLDLDLSDIGVSTELPAAARRGSPEAPIPGRLRDDPRFSDPIRLAAVAQAMADRQRLGLLELSAEQVADLEARGPNQGRFLDALEDYEFNVRIPGAADAATPGLEQRTLSFAQPSPGGDLPAPHGGSRYYRVSEVTEGGALMLNNDQGETLTVQSTMSGVSHPFEVGDAVALKAPVQGFSGARAEVKTIRPGAPRTPGEALTWKGDPQKGQWADVGRADVSTLKTNADVSRKHAQLYLKPDGSLWLKDVGSTQGTRIRSEGAWVPLEPKKWHRIQPGEVFLLGETEMRVSADHKLHLVSAVPPAETSSVRAAEAPPVSPARSRRDEITPPPLVDPQRDPLRFVDIGGTPHQLTSFHRMGSIQPGMIPVRLRDAVPDTNPLHRGNIIVFMYTPDPKNRQIFNRGHAVSLPRNYVEVDLGIPLTPDGRVAVGRPLPKLVLSPAEVQSTLPEAARKREAPALRSLEERQSLGALHFDAKGDCLVGRGANINGVDVGDQIVSRQHVLVHQVDVDTDVFEIGNLIPKNHLNGKAYGVYVEKTSGSGEWLQLSPKDETGSSYPILPGRRFLLGMVKGKKVGENAVILTIEPNAAGGYDLIREASIPPSSRRV